MNAGKSAAYAGSMHGAPLPVPDLDREPCCCGHGWFRHSRVRDALRTPCLRCQCPSFHTPSARPEIHAALDSQGDRR